eukprot:jgi/Botrbrau1/17483/Bobra.0054s0067.2
MMRRLELSIPRRYSTKKSGGSRSAVGIRASTKNAEYTVQGPRPFSWEDEVYVSFWIKFGWNKTMPFPPPPCWSTGWGSKHSCEYMALGRMNFSNKTIGVSHVFNRPLIGKKLKTEKNWAFFIDASKLYFYYALGACTIVFRYDKTLQNGAALHYAACFQNPSLVEQETGLHIRKARLSAHPILWNEGATLERVVMVHTRPTQHTYAHWLIRINPILNDVVAISKGPVLQSSNFHLRGYFPGVLVVGSFHHVVDKDKKQVLRVLVGEGDQYSGWLDLEVGLIKWWHVPRNQTFALSNSTEVFKYLNRTLRVR